MQLSVGGQESSVHKREDNEKGWAERRERKREERKDTLELCWRLSLSIQLITEQHMHVQKIPEPETEPLEKIRGLGEQRAHRARGSRRTCVRRSAWRTSRCPQVEYPEVSCRSSGEQLALDKVLLQSH